MVQSRLVRIKTGDSGTFGEWDVDGFKFYTVELPWRNNLQGYSCIPAGKYGCIWSRSPSKGYCYHIEGVNGRDGILIHSANFGGDRKKGYKCQLQGCIAPGESSGTLDGQDAVLGSRKAITQIEAILDHEPFLLEIAWGNGLDPEGSK